MRNNSGGRPSKLPFVSPRLQRNTSEPANNAFEIGESSNQRAKNWTDQHKAILVNCVREQFILGNFASGTPTKAGWNTITPFLNATIGRNETLDQYKQAWKNIRAVFRKYEELSNRSGWGWDDVAFRPVVPDEVWDEFLKDHPDFKVCRLKSFPLFPIMKEILSDNYATGEFRRANNQRSPTRSLSPVQPQPDPFASEYQFIDDNTPTQAPMSTTPTSNNSSGSKRTVSDVDMSQTSVPRRRRQKTSLFHEELKNAYLERNEILRMGFQQVHRAPAAERFTIHDAVGKMRQISHLLTETGKIGLLDVFNSGQNLIDTFMTIDDDLLRRWITFVITKYTTFKDEGLDLNTMIEICLEEDEWLFGSFWKFFGPGGMDLNDMIQLCLEDDEMLIDSLFPTPIVQRDMFTRPLSGQQYVQEILAGHEGRSYNFLRMSPNTFTTLSSLLQERHLLAPTSNMEVHEQVAIFIRVVAHSDVYRTVAEIFQHSLETISRIFNHVLHGILQLSESYIKMPSSDSPCAEQIRSNRKFYPFFKGAIGAIDGTHVPAIVPKRYQNRFRNRKDFTSQNVLAAVNFERQFVFVQTGWEGSAADMRVLRSAVDDRNFIVPNGKYFLADSGYANTAKFLTPIRGFRYHISSYRTAEQRVYSGPEELYNHRHAQLRNVVERTFGIVKQRFRILTQMRQFSVKTQADIVLSCCILHNFISTVNSMDIYMNMPDDQLEALTGGDIEYEILDDLTPVGDRIAGENLRNQIMGNLWTSFRRVGDRG